MWRAFDFGAKLRAPTVRREAGHGVPIWMTMRLIVLGCLCFCRARECERQVVQEYPSCDSLYLSNLSGVSRVTERVE